MFLTSHHVLRKCGVLKERMPPANYAKYHLIAAEKMHIELENEKAKKKSQRVSNRALMIIEFYECTCVIIPFSLYLNSRSYNGMIDGLIM